MYSSTAGEASASSSSSSSAASSNTLSNLTMAEAEGSSTIPAGRLTYDVFLSFRGSDTRHGFISHLYNALQQKGISTFKDDLKLERGKLISPSILRVIQRSRFSIVVFSEDYASSPWCLEELQTIIESMESDDDHNNKTSNHAVFPIFYGIDPSDVSEIKNSYADSFAKHEKDFPRDPELLASWKAALNKAAELSGWDSRNRDEPALINEIVADVLNKLGREHQNKSLGGLVGMETRIKEVELLLLTGLVEVRMVGIWGMPGIGKTTTAEAVYHKISHKFDACCFLKGVREVAEKRGLDHLRNKLLSALIVEDGLRILDQQLDVLMKGRLRTKCVLIVLDDVASRDELMSLVGDRDWFGSGSRIIITTKDKHLLEQHEVDAEYEAKPLSDVESLQLFCENAFKKGSPVQDFKALSQRVVTYSQGLPLALKLLGLSLYNMDRGEWESKLNTLEDVPPRNVVRILRLSFDVLDNSEKNIFLDIACFFRGEDKDYIVSLLEACGFSAVHGLRVLLHRSLIIIQDNKVLMHDLLQQMGWEIARQERCRLWNHQDVCNLLAQKPVPKDVQGVVLDTSKVNEEIGVEALHEMERLRVLKICNLHQSGSSEYVFRKESYPHIGNSSNERSKLHILGKLRTLSHELKSFEWHGHSLNSIRRRYTGATDPKLHYSGKLKTLSNELRSLHWLGYPFQSLPANFYPRNLVELNLSCSGLKNFWTTKKAFDKLKFMKLSHSQELTHTPDFSLMQNLEILILEGCIKLIEVHPSIGGLEKLIYLNMKGCKSLRYLPPSIGMRSLEVLELSGCSKLKKLPEVRANMGNLSELLLDGTDIAEIPGSIQNLTGLLVLSVAGCKRLESIPGAVGRCRALKILHLSGCSNLQLLQFELNKLENLEEVHADGTALRLRYLAVGGQLKKLKVLTLRGSNKAPSSIQKAWRDHLSETVGSHYLMRFISFSSDCFGFTEFSSLTSLDLSNCNLPDPLYDISCLVCLRTLDLSGNLFSNLYVDGLPKNLEVLLLANCKKLCFIPSLPSTTYRVEAPNCTSLRFIVPPKGIESARMRGFNLLNCSELGFVDEGYSPHPKGEIAVELLKVHVEKTPSHSVAELSIIIPGSEITPEWLPYQHMNSSIAAVMLPPDWYNDTLKGLALWATFEVRGEESIAPADLRLEFHCRSNGRTVISEVGFELSSGTKVESDHMWLRFIPALLFKTVRRRESWSPVEAVVVTCSPCLVVKSCGLYPICRDNEGHLVEINPSNS
ncbi:unnamed protein product [Linum tenue]|uniref:ADP-ribosyl cyclase/cyclic ADP-ribose hydrolase n=1 Tax=Linum tenue TaxID=586396 RepID=A0AAV0LL87_9ROSI|nr:unnamed protein product [Linum tenue]